MSGGFLSAAFRQPRTQLELTLDEQTGTENVTHALRTVLTRLERVADEDGELDARVRPQLVAALDLLRAAVLGTLSTVRAPAVAPPRHRPPPRRPGLRLPFLGGGDDDEERREWEREEERLRRPQRPVVHTASLLEQFQAAVEAADRLLAEAEPPPPVRVPIAWHQDAELVNLIRDLMAAHAESDGDLALRHIDRLRKELALRHDIEVVDFDGTNEYLFTLGTHPGPADGRYRTVQPALVTTDGRVLRRGEATGPFGGPPAPHTETGNSAPPTRGGRTGNGESGEPGDGTGDGTPREQGDGTRNNGGKEHSDG
ncbi:hypothetical protein [Streptomyces sp. NBC_00996]|uniref:hypothetical protein n=1 Tax=Streptomyces sp. NBC_00996 TaxID=2903710 RepID=UPI003864DAFA|nr:hypothetical protein OG390_44160 [Streptomyces sp. NBC_00996]